MELTFPYKTLSKINKYNIYHKRTKCEIRQDSSGFIKIICDNTNVDLDKLDNFLRKNIPCLIYSRSIYPKNKNRQGSLTSYITKKYITAQFSYDLYLSMHEVVEAYPFNDRFQVKPLTNNFYYILDVVKSIDSCMSLINIDNYIFTLHTSRQQIIKNVNHPKIQTKIIYTSQLNNPTFKMTILNMFEKFGFKNVTSSLNCNQIYSIDQFGNKLSIQLNDDLSSDESSLDTEDSYDY